MQTISILGCGWLGLPLGAALAKAGFQIKGATTTAAKTARLKSAGITPYVLNFNPDVEHTADFFDTDVLIINLPPRNQNEDEDYHKKQLQAIRQYCLQHQISKVLFVSSTAVYPNCNREVHEEDASPTALSRGGIPLLLMEQIFTSTLTFQTTVVRFGGLYGPERHPGRFLAGKKGVPGASNPVNMIHLEDCIGVIQSIIQQSLWNKTYNACAPSHPRRDDFYLQATQKLDLPPPQFSTESKDFKRVSPAKLLKETGYQFVHNPSFT
ncbi:SDR family oxidoreductase [Marinoscillum furvescens]|uniref:Nucleoside-diphosphate-sugar epimerase n=1 Tax=Marinoscillum furvescens DSM 4134 TaxID=1122208 RepID=A0A3D9L3Q1_MARFU|nr:SDR family oxidoreductase [Marinoscillum furvescens]RED99873.1 nucleoside-diphosphate-sugar epimerase [Marinoscillum furvescens DSM 4134]